MDHAEHHRDAQARRGATSSPDDVAVPWGPDLDLETVRVVAE